MSRVCTTVAELDAALAEAANAPRLCFIEVALQPLDMTAATRFVGEGTRVYDYGIYGPQNPLS